MTILIIGGTGRVGSAAIGSLVKSGVPLRCLSHNAQNLAALPAGVEPAFADLDDPATLKAAFKGVSSVLLSLTVHPNEAARGLAALKAAQDAGVEKVVHVSLKHYPGSESRVFYQAKQDIERHLQASPFQTVILRSANFFQSDSTQKAYILEQGVFAPPIGSIGVDRIDSRDVGYAAAAALINDDYDGQEADLYGPETFTGESVAAVYAQASGRPVSYMGDDIAGWVALNQSRLGPWYVDALKGLYEQQQRYGMLRPSGVPQHPLLPRDMRRFQDYAAEQVAAWSR